MAAASVTGMAAVGRRWGGSGVAMVQWVGYLVVLQSEVLQTDVWCLMTLKCVTGKDLVAFQGQNDKLQILIKWV